MLSTIVLIPLVLLSQWIPISRAHGSLPRLFLSKLEVIITFFELCGKGISHLWTLHICNLSSWTLLKTQNFPLFSQNFLIHYSVIWFHQMVFRCFFLSTTKGTIWLCNVYTFLSKSPSVDIAPTSIWCNSKSSMPSIALWF